MSPADRIVWALGALSLIVSGCAIVAAIAALVADRYGRRDRDVLPPPVRQVHRTSSSLIDVDFRNRRRVS